MHRHASGLSEIGPTRVSDAVRVGRGQPCRATMIMIDTLATLHQPSMMSFLILCIYLSRRAPLGDIDSNVVYLPSPLQTMHTPP